MRRPDHRVGRNAVKHSGIHNGNTKYALLPVMVIVSERALG
jgi:hypothetical protein